jgi:hypothetical protein
MPPNGTSNPPPGTGMPDPGTGMPPSGNAATRQPGGMPDTGNGMPPDPGGMPPHGTRSRRPALTGRPHSPCSPPPRRRERPYDHRPAAGPGRTRRHPPPAAARQEVRVIYPDQPPALTPGAARVLLRILRKSQEQANRHERKEDRP